MNLKQYIRQIPNYPKPGILFYDLTTLWQNPKLFHEHIDRFVEKYKNQKNIDKIVGIESRGFILGSALAYSLKLGLVLVRKPGKLPFKVLKKEYTLEYGKNTLEIHKDAIEKGDQILVVDDLIATGGTIASTIDLIEMLEGKVQEVAAIVELSTLEARKKINKPIFSLVQY